MNWIRDRLLFKGMHSICWFWVKNTNSGIYYSQIDTNNGWPNIEFTAQGPRQNDKNIIWCDIDNNANCVEINKKKISTQSNNFKWFTNNHKTGFTLYCLHQLSFFFSFANKRKFCADHLCGIWLSFSRFICRFSWLESCYKRILNDFIH